MVKEKPLFKEGQRDLVSLELPFGIAAFVASGTQCVDDLLLSGPLLFQLCDGVGFVAQ